MEEGTARKEASIVVLCRDFVMLAVHPGANIRELCRRFTISPTTGYKWLYDTVSILERVLATGRAVPGLAPRAATANRATDAGGARGTRPGEPARFGRGCEPWVRQRCQPPVPFMLFSAVMGGSTRPSRPNISGGSVSSMRPPISCGRWISKGILPWATTPPVTP